MAVACRSPSPGAPAASRRPWGGLPGRLVAVGADTLQLSLGVPGAGLKPVAGLRCRRAQPRPVPRGVLADLRHPPVRILAGPVQLRAGRPGRLPRPGRVLPGSCGPGPGLARPGLRAGHRLVPLTSTA